MTFSAAGKEELCGFIVANDTVSQTKKEERNSREKKKAKAEYAEYM